MDESFFVWMEVLFDFLPLFLFARYCFHAFVVLDFLRMVCSQVLAGLRAYLNVFDFTVSILACLLEMASSAHLKNV